MIERIAHYRLIEPLGSGGMGDVYLAEDTKLGRKVALKVLQQKTSGDRKHQNRFLQEARLAANLNHPNICTIYEIDAASDPPFLAMELIEGETLADRIAGGELTTSEIVSVASQIADALDEAHRAGVIHRDIKASNVIINNRGRIKILDFGLAKSIADDVTEEDVTRAKTEDGMLVGTVQYMSPEQALGKKLDGRTDLWSLGVLIYEMIEGRLPFKAATQAATFDAILNREPPPIEADVPAEIAAVVSKLLEKDRDLRYWSAADLIVDLRRVWRAIGDASDSGETTGIAARNTLSGTVFFSGRSAIGRARKRRLKIIAAVGVVALLALAGVVFLLSRGPLTVPSRPLSLSVSSRQTNLGKVVDAVISPAGDHIVYVTDEGAKQSLWIKQTSGGSALQIVAPSELVFQGLAISPDNKWVYYNVWDRVSVGQIFRIPALGGTPQKVVNDCMPGTSVSPGGDRITYARSDDRNGRFVILTAGADGSGEREIASLPGSFAYRPVWAPDGRSIAFGLFNSEAGRRFPQIVEIPAEGGEFKTLWRDEENRFQPNRFVWLPNKSGLLLTLANSREFRTQIWQVDYPSGELRQITRDLNSYSAISLSADGSKLLAIQEDLLLSVWTMPANKPAEARRITEGKTEGIGVDWTADGRIVYSSNVSGNAEIWMMRDDGSGKRQLTSDGSTKLSPCVSGDGQFIFYGLAGNERGGAARMDTEGRNATTLDGKWNILCSSGSDKVLHFAQSGDGNVELFRNTASLDSPVPVPRKGYVNVALSPDGERIAYVFWDEVRRRHDFGILSLKDGTSRQFDLPLTAVQKYSESQFVLRWTPDGKNLSFVNDENGFANIWLLPLNGEKQRRITSFNDNFIFSFAWSKDGKKIAASRGTLTSDAVLYER